MGLQKIKLNLKKYGAFIFLAASALLLFGNFNFSNLQEELSTNAALCWIETQTTCCASCGNAQSRTRECCEGVVGCGDWSAWSGCSATGSPSCACGGGTCNPGEWAACGAHGCPADHSPQCNPSGTGWNCVYNPGTCGGGACTQSAPGAANLQSPENNAIMPNNDVSLSWTNPTGWGSGCPNTNRFRVLLQPDCAGAFINHSGNLSSATLNYTANNLDWGRTYCWRVQKNNGALSTNSSIRRFTVNNTSVLDSHGIVSPNVCGTNFSGRIDNQGTNNPIDYELNFSDAESDQFLFVYFFLVPSSGPNAENAATASLSTLRTKVSASNSLGARFTVSNGNLATMDTLGNFVVGGNNGDFTNQSGTATILNVGGASYIVANANTASASFRIQFNNSFPSGNYNIYASALTQNSDGTNVTTHADSTNNLLIGRINNWSIDTQNPSVVVSGPTFNNNGTFDVNWSATDNNSISSVGSFAWGTQEGGQIRDNGLNLTIPLELSKPALPNAGITTDNLGTHNYTDLTPDLFNSYSMELEAQDVACNVTSATLGFDSPSPWLISYLGTISTNGGFRNIKVPDINNFTVPNTSDTGVPFLATYAALSGTVDMPAARQSRNNFYDTNYNNLAVLPPIEAEFSSWYDYLLDLFQKNDVTQLTNIDASVLGGSGGNFSDKLGVPSGSKGAWIVNGELILEPNNNCNVRGIFFVEQRVIIRPDFISDGNNGCIFVSRARISVPAGLPKSTPLSTGYDLVDGVFITDGQFRANEDQATPDYWDGLLIDGGVVSRTSLLERDLKFEKNGLNPAIIFRFNPTYLENFREDLAVRNFSIREK